MKTKENEVVNNADENTAKVFTEAEVEEILKHAIEKRDAHINMLNEKIAEINNKNEQYWIMKHIDWCIDIVKNGNMFTNSIVVKCLEDIENFFINDTNNVEENNESKTNE